jgi:sorting nexin-13
VHCFPICFFVLLCVPAFIFFINLFFGRFINEKIEFLVLKMTKANKGFPVQGTSQSKPDESSRISSDHFSKFLDPSVTGVELVQLKNAQSRTAADTSATDHVNGNKDPLLSIDPRSTRSWNSLPFNSQTSDESGLERQRSGGEWGDMLDQISRRKNQALAPEHFENMWTKGRDYKKKEGENRVIEQVPPGSSAAKSLKVDNLKATSKPKEKNTITKLSHSESGAVHSGCTARLSIENSFHHTGRSVSNRSSFVSYEEDDEHNHMLLEETDSGSSTSYTSEDEETSNVTGLDSPVTKVWDGRSNRNLSISHIHHPLENSEGRIAKKNGKGRLHYQRLARTPSSHKRSRTRSQKTHIWQEVERTSFLSGDGQDILSSAKGHANVEDSSEDSEIENFGRVQSGAAASSSAPSFSIPESQSLTVNSLQNSLAVDSFFKLRCEVLIIKPCNLSCFGMFNLLFSDVLIYAKDVSSFAVAGIGRKYCEEWFKNICCLFNICYRRK